MGPSTSYGFDELALSLGSTSWVTFDELDLGLRSSAGFDELWVLQQALGSTISFQLTDEQNFFKYTLSHSDEIQ